MTQPFKVCPQCQQPAHIHAVLCGTCGRKFQSTAPLVNQTQVFSAGSIPPPQGRYQQSTAPVPQVGGPRDQVEWMSSCIWTWVGTFFIASMFCFGVRGLFDESLSDSARGFELLFCLIFCSILTALIHRLRRLYIYFAFRRYRWWVPTAIVSCLIAIMLFGDHERRAQSEARSEARRSAVYDAPYIPAAQIREPAFRSFPSSYSRSSPATSYPPPSSQRDASPAVGSSQPAGGGVSFGGALGESPPVPVRPSGSGGFGGGGSGAGGGQGFGGGGVRETP